MIARLRANQLWHAERNKAPMKPYAWTFFVDSCVRRGQAAALAMLPDGNL
jgi:hypothetical protein